MTAPESANLAIWCERTYIMTDQGTVAEMDDLTAAQIQELRAAMPGRKGPGMTQDAFARAVGIEGGKRTVTRWETEGVRPSALAMRALKILWRRHMKSTER
tara:strand:- start:51 stop:353 length:303 start_codon:yes stop_codon:yes gene_type:complete